jgi:hypothetical protein
MFAPRRDEMIAREKATIGTQRVILKIFCRDVSLIIRDALSYGK